MPTATFTDTIVAPPERVAELLRTCLARAGWRIELINDDLCELTALMNKKQPLGGVQWIYEYRCVASWEPLAFGATVTLEVSEDHNHWTLQDCNQKCLQLMQELKEKAAKLAQVGQQKTRAGKQEAVRWGSHDDIVKAGYWGGHEDSRRLVIGPGFDDNFVSVTPEDTAKHAIVCGPTGSGKTTAVFVPNLVLRLKSSAIVTEATAGNEPPDLYHKTAGYRFAAGGQHIYYFNPDDLRSHRINPIDAVTSYAKAQELAQLIIENTTSKNNYGDDVWPKSEANLLTILIAHAAAERQHLGYIRALLRKGPDGLLPVLLQSKVPQVGPEYQGFCNNSREGFKYGVFAGLMQRLGLWVNPRIVALTEATDFDLSELQHQLFTFYLATPAQKTHLKPVAALIFNFILEQALERQFDHPLFLSLDEFTNFGFIPGIAQKLSIIRHRNIGVMLGFQDYSQLVDVYGRQAAYQLFSQPRTKVFFRLWSPELARMISEAGGTATVVERKMTSSGQIHERETRRPLIEPGELAALPEQEILAFTPKCPPLKMPRFTWEDFEATGAMEPVPRQEIAIDERLVTECQNLKEKENWQMEGEEARQAEVAETISPPKNKQQPGKGEAKQSRNRFKKKNYRARPEQEGDDTRKQQGPSKPGPDRDAGMTYE